MAKKILNETVMDNLINDFQDGADWVLDVLSDSNLQYFCSTTGIDQDDAIELRERITALSECLDGLYAKHFVINTNDLPF